MWKCMPRIYDNNFKFMMVDLIVNKKNSTSKTAEKYGVPLKTLEKWITSYNKDKTSFGTENLTKEEQIKELKKQLKRLEEEQRNIKETIELMEK